MKLPCMTIEIIANLDPFILNLSLSFLILGLSRYNREEKEELIELSYGFLMDSYSEYYIKVLKIE